MCLVEGADKSIYIAAHLYQQLMLIGCAPCCIMDMTSYSGQTRTWLVSGCPYKILHKPFVQPPEQSKYIKKGKVGVAGRFEVWGVLLVVQSWPLDLMTKLEGAPYRADYSGKRAVYHRQFLTGCRRIFYTSSPQSPQTQTYYLRTQTHQHTNINTHKHTKFCVWNGTRWKYSCATVWLDIGWELLLEASMH